MHEGKINVSLRLGVVRCCLNVLMPIDEIPIADNSYRRNAEREQIARTTDHNNGKINYYNIIAYGSQWISRVQIRRFHIIATCPVESSSGYTLVTEISLNLFVIS